MRTVSPMTFRSSRALPWSTDPRAMCHLDRSCGCREQVGRQLCPRPRSHREAVGRDLTIPPLHCELVPLVDAQQSSVPAGTTEEGQLPSVAQIDDDASSLTVGAKPGGPVFSDIEEDHPGLCRIR